MRARLGVPLVLVMSMILAVVVGTNAATGQTVMHLTLSGDTQKIRETNVNGGGLGLGDRVAARGPLTNGDGATVGTAYGDCVVHRQIKGPETGLWTCAYVLELADGNLTLNGLDPRGPGVYEMAILGGTGAYENASGDATFTDTFDANYAHERTDMEIRLSQ
jgi:hypothetical protein